MGKGLVLKHEDSRPVSRTSVEKTRKEKLCVALGQQIELDPWDLVGSAWGVSQAGERP